MSRAKTLDNPMITQMIERESFSNPIGTKRYLCPECSEERSQKNQREKCLSVTYEEQEAVYYCHHCERKGNVHMTEELPTPRTIRTAPNFSMADQEFLNEQLNKRGIRSDSLPSEITETLVQSEEIYFRDLGGKSDAIGFRYTGEDIKWRSTTEKCYSQTGNCKALYPRFKPEDKHGVVVIVEGEYDALSLRSCGYDAYSVPGGANVPSNKEVPTYLKDVVEALSEDKIDVVVAVDSDKKGRQFEKWLMDILGRRRVGVIDWAKYGVKDANECLITHGEKGLKEAFQEVKNILYEGIVRVSSVIPTIDEIRVGGFTEGAKIGIPSVDRLLTFCVDQLSVVTGHPGSGKSEFVDYVMVALARRKNWKFGIFSAENPIPIHAGKIMEKHTGKPLFEGQKMDSEELKDAADWMEEHFFFFDPASSSTLDSILSRAQVLVENEGINGVVIDPFNYTDVSLETEAISAMLTKLHLFAKTHHVHVFIVAHPQKMYREKGKVPIPTGYDISGSAAWYAKADFGYTLSRDEAETVLTVWKCRFKWLGQTGSAYMKYNPLCGRYSEGTSLGDIRADLSRVVANLSDVAYAKPKSPASVVIEEAATLAQEQEMDELFTELVPSSTTT